MSPQRPAPHGITVRHACSPGTAMRPGWHGSLGRIGSQPYSPSCAKPSAQPSGGTPGRKQLPSGRSSATGSAHTTGGGSGVGAGVVSFGVLQPTRAALMRAARITGAEMAPRANTNVQDTPKRARTYG